MEFSKRGIINRRIAAKQRADIRVTEVENTLRTIFRRCLACPDVTPSCPKCASDETCSLSSGSCTSCASTSCIKTSTLDGNSGSHKPPIGAIIGGVIGGVAVVLIVTFLVWRFCIRNRRREYDEQAWSEYDEAAEKSRDRFTMNRDARASTHTVGSIASTVLTRASNVIQIAYIPGVTNRSPPESPGIMVPPVPPLPLASMSSSSNSTPRINQEQHFFMPGDLRDSTWSDLSENDSRQSITPSLARDLSRDSVATTVFRDTAVISPNPTQTALRGKAAVVSVKTGSGQTTPTGTPRTGTPPLGAHEFTPPNKALASSNSSIVARAISAKAIQVKKSPSQTRVPTRMNSVENSTDEVTDSTLPRSASKSNSIASHSRAKKYLAGPTIGTISDDSDSDPHERSHRFLSERPRESTPLTIIEDSPAVQQGPFADNPQPPSSTGSSTGVNPEIPSCNPTHDGGPSHRHKKSRSLSELIQEATRRASRASITGLGSYETVPGSAKRDLSPFDDENEVHGS
jgi:protein OPY2